MPKYASCEVLILDDTSSIYIFHSQGIGTRSARESAGPPTSTNSSRHDVVDDDDRVKIVYQQEMDSCASVLTDSDSTDSEVDTRHHVSGRHIASLVIRYVFTVFNFIFPILFLIFPIFS